MRRIVGILALLCLTAMPAAAQDRPVTFNLGGGVTFPLGDLSDSFDTGWNFQVGVSGNITDVFGFEVDYMYHRLDGPQRFFPSVPGSADVLIESNHQMHVGSFNLVARSNPSAAVGAYVLAGPGIYHRIVQLTTPSVGFATVCDPYWFVCYPVAVSVDQIIGDRSSTDFGFDVGGGITFGTVAKFFIEGRYHYVWGPEVERADRKLNASYFPITFGLRF